MLLGAPSGDARQPRTGRTPRDWGGERRGGGRGGETKTAEEKHPLRFAERHHHGKTNLSGMSAKHDPYEPSSANATQHPCSSLCLL